MLDKMLIKENKLTIHLLKTKISKTLSLESVDSPRSSYFETSATKPKLQNPSHQSIILTKTYILTCKFLFPKDTSLLVNWLSLIYRSGTNTGKNYAIVLDTYIDWHVLCVELPT